MEHTWGKSEGRDKLLLKSVSEIVIDILAKVIELDKSLNKVVVESLTSFQNRCSEATGIQNVEKGVLPSSVTKTTNLDSANGTGSIYQEP